MATSRPDESTAAPSPISPLQTSLDLDSGISLPASAGGLKRSDLPGPPMMPTSGPEVARVNRSRTRARGEEFSTLDIFGRHGSHSSESASLQSSLESRLRVAMGSLGSTLFSLTWNDAVTPSGRRICALRASGRRTQDSGCSSWPTPTVSRGDYSYANGNHETPTLKLAGAAKLACWPTATARDWKSSASNKHGDNARPLNEVARLAHWATPVSGDANGGGAPTFAHGGRDLRNMVKTAAWPTPDATARGTVEPPAGMVRASGAKAQLTLQAAVALASWPTARASDGAKGGKRRVKTGQDLPTTVQLASWATPADAGTIHGAQGQGQGREHRRLLDVAVPAGATGGFWGSAEWVLCRDPAGGSPVARPVEPGTFPLASGVPGRVGLLRGYGNSIVPQVAAGFIRAAMAAITHRST